MLVVWWCRCDTYGQLLSFPSPNREATLFVQLIATKTKKTTQHILPGESFQNDLEVHFEFESQYSRAQTFVTWYLLSFSGGLTLNVNLRCVKLHTLAETNVAPENRQSQKENSSSNHPFWGAMLDSGKVPSVMKPISKVSTAGHFFRVWCVLENFVSTTWAREDCPRVECHILRHFKEDQFRMIPFDYGEKQMKNDERTSL